MIGKMLGHHQITSQFGKAARVKYTWPMISI